MPAGPVAPRRPIARGLALPEAELDRRLAAVYGEGRVSVRGQPALLRPAGRRETLVRMLRNLVGIYRDRGGRERQLDALTAALTLTPDLAEELRARGLLYAELGYAPAALADLRRFSEVAWDVEAIASVLPLIEELASRPARLH